jgi:tetratricopeptide (TPR) repeat protein
LTLGRTERAVHHLEAALRVDPSSVEGHYNLGLAFTSQGRLEAAVQHFHRALSLRPDHVQARINLGAVLRAEGRPDEAVSELRRALRLDPGNASAHANLGGALAAGGNVHEAVDAYRAALAARPDLLEPLVSLAWILATAPDEGIRRPSEAVRLAERAAQLARPDSVLVSDTLAAAYAANGDFSRALAIAEPALNDALAGGATRDAELLGGRISLYRKRQPYRDPVLALRPRP